MGIQTIESGEAVAACGHPEGAFAGVPKHRVCRWCVEIRALKNRIAELEVAKGIGLDRQGEIELAGRVAELAAVLHGRMKETM